MMLVVGDRVWRVVDPDARIYQDVGTVESISQAGYIKVRWDGFGTELFTGATKDIRKAEGDDALPRHRWDGAEPDAVCLHCRALQTDENEFKACKEPES